MSNILFLYNNLLDSATLTASSEASGFPASNLKSPFRSKVWRTAGATAGTANLVINHGSAKAVNCVALTGYNWASAPGTLKLEFNATDSWGAPAASETLTWAANPTANGNKATIIKTFEAKTYQYNRLSVVYSPGGSPTDWDLGRMFVGQYFMPDAPYQYGFTNHIVDPSLVDRTIGGQLHADEIEKYREIEFSIMPRSQAQWELFQTMLNSRGITNDLFVAFDYTSEPDEMTMYGHFADSPVMTQSFKTNMALPFVFREAR